LEEGGDGASGHGACRASGVHAISVNVEPDQEVQAMKRLYPSILSIAAILALAVASASSADGGRRGLRADLKGFNENPTLSTPGRGTFSAVINRDETEITYRLNFSNLEAAVTQAHIHFGTPHINGGISVWLCGTAGLPGPVGTPTCAVPGSGPEASGTITAANVTAGAGAQGILAGEFAELIRALRAGVTYANVHTTKYPGGEIRGQIRADDDD